MFGFCASFRSFSLTKLVRSKTIAMNHYWPWAKVLLHLAIILQNVFTWFFKFLLINNGNDVNILLYSKRLDAVDDNFWHLKRYAWNNFSHISSIMTTNSNRLQKLKKEKKERWFIETINIGRWMSGIEMNIKMSGRWETRLNELVWDEWAENWNKSTKICKRNFYN